MEKKKTILVLEQETNLANGLKTILEKEGYTVVSVFNHHDLKELSEDKRPDLAIININIPKEFGLNILRKTKESFLRIPIIALSVYSNSFSKKELSRLGADAFIAKPFDVKYFKEKVKELIGSKKLPPIKE